MKPGDVVWARPEGSSAWRQVTIRQVYTREALVDDGDPKNPNTETNGWHYAERLDAGRIRRDNPYPTKAQSWKRTHEKFIVWLSSPDGVETQARLKALQEEERTLMVNLLSRFSPVPIVLEPDGALTPMELDEMKRHRIRVLRQETHGHRRIHASDDPRTPWRGP